MQAQDIMTRNPVCCTPQATAREVAQLMAKHDCGCIPVVEDVDSRRLIGVVTDRDLAVRGMAEGKGPDTRVDGLMTTGLDCCAPDSDINVVQKVMAERQVRRVPIVDERGCCVGIVAQADLARAEGRGVSDREVAIVVERISEPMRGSSPRGDTRLEQQF